MIPNDRPIHLLFVEDNPADAALISELLEAAYAGQYLVEVAPSLLHAERAIAKHDFSAILLDLSLPDSQGIGTIEHLVKTSQVVPIIVLTGSNDEEAAAEAVRCGAQDYLRKGFVDGPSIAKAIRYAIDRKSSEAARRESESQYRALVENISLGVCMIGPDHRIRMVNGALARLFRKDPRELVGKECFREFEKGAAPCPHCPGKQAMATGKPVEAVSEGIRDDGERRAVRLQAFPSLSPDGQAIGFIEVVEDVTERKLASDALKASEEKYRQLFLTETNAIALADARRRRFFDVNESACRMYGYTREEFLGLTQLDMSAEPDATVEFLAEASRRRRAFAPLRYHKKKDGSLFPVEMSASCFVMQGRQVMCGVFRDITERVRADEALRRSEAVLAEAQRIANVGSWELDVRSGKLDWSDQLYHMFGEDRRTFVPTNEKFLDHVHPQDSQRVADAINDALMKQSLYNIELQIVTTSGAARVLLSQGEVVRDAQGRPIRMVGTALDITERKRLEAQFVQAQKMEAVGRLAAGVAHDFNNQLTVIQGYVDMLLAGCKPGDPLWAPLFEIRRAGERAYSTTSHLLSFSRRQVLHPEPCDINELLKAMRGPVATMIGEQIKFTVIADPGARPVLIDRSGMQQAMMNLIVNARDAMPNGGKLTLRTGNPEIGPAGDSCFPDVPAGQYTLVEVSDSGAGMSAEIMDRAFEPFFTTKNVGEGTGLGLPMVQGFVRQSHGFIDIRSEPGKGTVASILLPAAAEALLEAQRMQREYREYAAVQAKGNGTILVVEDEEEVCNLIVRYLRADGYDVLEAATPSQAIAIVTEHEEPLDLLITDMVMPEMNGTVMAKRIEAICKSIRTLFITGYAKEESRKSVRNVLLKPFAMDTLSDAVRKTLGRDGPLHKP